MVSDYFIENKDQINTILEVNTDLNGELSFETSLQMKGKFKGIINASGLLIIDKDAYVEADIKTKDIVIAGSVKGNIIATNKLEIEPTGKLTGDIKTFKLKIADGVYFEGNCEMLSQEDLLKISVHKKDVKIEKSEKSQTMEKQKSSGKK